MRTRHWLKEPLVHFLLFGALIFAADAMLFERVGPTPAIRVDAQVIDQLASGFEQSRRRVPTPGELDQLVEGWIQQEVWYREGLEMGLDRADAFVRERVATLAKGLMMRAADPGFPSRDQLLDHYERNRDAYVRPEQFDIEHFILPVSTGADGREQAIRLLERLEAGAEPSEIGHRLMRTEGRSAAQLAVIFGTDFAATIEGMQTGKWSIVRSRQTWHVVRVHAVNPGGLPPFEFLEERLADDWRQDRQLEEAASRYRRLLDKYQVVRESYPARGAELDDTGT